MRNYIMKYLFMLSLCLILFSCIFIRYGLPEKSQILWVKAEEGIILRENPDIKSNKIDIVPFASEIIYIDRTLFELSVDNMLDYWYKVKWKSNIGWIFARYLTLDKNEIEAIILERKISNPFNFKLNIGVDINTIKSIFGEPLKIVKTERRFQLGRKGNRFIEIYYDGIVFDVLFTPTDKEKELPDSEYLYSIKLTNSRYKLKTGIKVGDNIELLKEKYGNYQFKYKNNISYGYNEYNNYGLSFTINEDNNTIEEIRWSRNIQ